MFIFWDGEVVPFIYYQLLLQLLLTHVTRCSTHVMTWKGGETSHQSDPIGEIEVGYWTCSQLIATTPQGSGIILCSHGEMFHGELKPAALFWQYLKTTLHWGQCFSSVVDRIAFFPPASSQWSGIFAACSREEESKGQWSSCWVGRDIFRPFCHAFWDLKVFLAHIILSSKLKRWI